MFTAVQKQSSPYSVSNDTEFTGSSNHFIYKTSPKLSYINLYFRKG